MSWYFFYIDIGTYILKSQKLKTKKFNCITILLLYNYCNGVILYIFQYILYIFAQTIGNLFSIQGCSFSCINVVTLTRVLKIKYG